MVEVQKRVADKAATSSSAKELLNSIKPFASPDFHAALMEALASVEAEGESVSLDGASAGYKKFAEKVKVGEELGARGCMMGQARAVELLHQLRQGIFPRGSLCMQYHHCRG